MKNKLALLGLCAALGLIIGLSPSGAAGLIIKVICGIVAGFTLNSLRPNKTIACLVALALLVATMPTVKVKADEPLKDEWAIVICGLIIIGIGCFVGCELKKVCDKHLPPLPPPTPPPTNSPPCTNLPPKRVSAPSANSALATCYSINGSLPGMDAPDGSRYDTYFYYTFETSTNLIQWQTMSVTGWASPTWIITSLAGKTSGGPRSTNIVIGMLPDTRMRFVRGM